MSRTAMVVTGPVEGVPRITGASSTQARTTISIRPDEPVFAGHYPGFPVLPGVCVVEYAHRSALVTAPKSLLPMELVAIESARFISPVFPGDELQIEVSGCHDGGHWRCEALGSTVRGPAAEIRLRYRVCGGAR